MEETLSKPKRRRQKWVLPVSGRATKDSSSKAKTEKPQSQSQALNDSAKNRNKRLNTFMNNDAKHTIDLTSDDIDSQMISKDSGTIKAQQPATRTANIPAYARQRVRLPPPPAIILDSVYSRSTTDGDDFMDSLDPQTSPPERSAKRARCEDIVDTADTVPKAFSTKQYHMAPPECPAISVGNTATAEDLKSRPKAAFSGFSLQVPTSPQFRSGLAASSSSVAPNPGGPLVTSPEPTPKAAENTPSAHNATVTKTETTAAPHAEHDIKTEHHVPRQNPAFPPSLLVKIKLAREFSQALGVPERHAYQLLMRHNWTVDDAVLDHMGTKPDFENAEDGEKKAVME